jgi:hypothetical protein
MEVWPGLSEDRILDMPSTRRQRLISKKVDLEKRRAEKK